MFDDAQDIVKAVSNDHAFKAANKIGAVNSINWARVAAQIVCAAQIVYYFKGYFAATKSNDEQVAFCVPSGNFGNICAGHIARQMGLPVAKLILATNENDVLDEFFCSGVYRPRKAAETRVTSSPSMDISKASNFERFVFDLVGRDPQKVAALWAEVDAGRAFDLSASPEFARIGDFGFVSGASNHADRLATIRKVFEQYGVMIDTHTADGVKVAWERAAEVPAGVPVLVLETALAVKFADTIVEALGREPERPADLAGIEKLPHREAAAARRGDGARRRGREAFHRRARLRRQEAPAPDAGRFRPGLRRGAARGRARARPWSACRSRSGRRRFRRWRAPARG